VRLWCLGGAIGLTACLTTGLAYKESEMSVDCTVFRLDNHCLEVLATRVPLPPGIFAFDSRKLDFGLGTEDIRDSIDGYPKVRAIVVVIYIRWLVFFERKNGHNARAKLTWTAKHGPF
jgi:hypothetical protein